MAQIKRSNDKNYFDSPDFIKIRASVFRLFDQKPALTKHAIQYRLCEVGAPADRRDPRDLKPAFLLRGTPLLRENVGRTRPWDPVSGVFLSSGIPEDEIPEVVGQILELCSEVAALLPGQRTLLLAESLHELLSPSSLQPIIGNRRQTSIANDIDIASEEIVVDISALSGAPVLASVTNDLDWVFPDDPRVWLHLERCREARAFPAFVCRKASIAAFPLFKRVAAIGIQLHHVLVRNDDLPILSDHVSSLGWPRVSGLQEIADHQAVSILREKFKGISRSFSLQLAFDSISRGIDLGLGRGGVGQAARLLEWGLQGDEEMPAKWITTIRQWVAWEERGLLAKPYEREDSSQVAQSDPLSPV